jgi:general stress protein 26
MPTAEQQPPDPAQVVEQALAVLRADRLCFLATTDGDQPRLRPITPVKTDGFTVYVVNLQSHNKTREIANNPKVELCYLDELHRQVRITGVAEVVNDPTLLQEIVGPKTLLNAYLETIDRSQFVVYRVRPTQVRYMEEWAAHYQLVPLGKV